MSAEFDDGPTEAPLSPEEEFMQWDYARQQRFVERPEIEIRRALRTLTESAWLGGTCVPPLSAKDKDMCTTILVDAVNELMSRRKG